MKKQYIAGIFVVVFLIGFGIGIFQKKQKFVFQEDVRATSAPSKLEEQLQPQQAVTSAAKDELSASEKNSTEKLAASSQKKVLTQQPSNQKKLARAPLQKAPKDMTESELLTALQETGKNEQYAKFADVLLEVYTRKLENKDNFKKAESVAYVKATEYLDKEKNPQKALDTADIVYKKVSFGWRFKYLRVRALEALGRVAFEAGDLTKAQEYAYTILTMEFRPEGANLLGDIFIKKSETALAKGDMQAAREAYEEIRDYEVSPDRKAKLDELAKKLQ